MKRMPSTREEVEQAVKHVADALGFTKAILFGSMARETYTERSDVDLVFIKDTSVRFLDRSIEALPMLADRIKGRGIDVLVYTPAEIESMILHGNRFIKRVLLEGKVIYGA